MVSIPLLEKEGWTRHQEMDPFRNGAAGVVSPARCQASTFRRTDHPVCGASVASQLSIDAAATPPFQGGECLLAICPPNVQTVTPPISSLQRGHTRRGSQYALLQSNWPPAVRLIAG